MTQAQYQWLKDNGYDPAVYDVDSGGRVIKNPIAQEEPQREVMSVPRAFGTSFLGNLMPSAAALAGGAAGMEGGAAIGALGGPAAPVTVPLFSILGGIGGGLGAGYLGGKGQQAALERFAPEALQEMAQAEQDQPVASWAGGSAPALLTFKPSLKGIEGLSAPLMRGRDVFTKFDPATISRFTPAAMNVGVNAANAGAGQLINMSEGGEFSLPRFAADTAFGAIVSNPNALGRRIGFPSLTPQRGSVTRLELTPEPTLGSPIEESQKLYGSMPESNVGRPPSVSQVSKADKSAYEAYSGYKEPEPSKSAETLARELYSAELTGPSSRGPSLGEVANADKTAYEAYSGQRPPPAPEVVKNATDAAREVYTRLQGPTEEGPARITQEDLDAASEIAAVRGLKLQFEDLGGGRGKFQLETSDGVPIISIDPNAATRDTAIHEIGHDVFARSVGEGMQKGLLGAVEESPTYRAEYEARLNARDEQGNPTHTEQQARDIALEEGLIQKFGEEYPNVKPGEIRQWFNALKASIKDLAGMKLSPEDANAYLRYLTNENVPWKGVAIGKTGSGMGSEERLQRAQQETPEFKSFFGASRVVDGQGKPKFVYHGTGSDITQFKKDLLDKGALYGPGIYMTDSVDVAGGLKGYSFKGLQPTESIGEFSVNENLPMTEQIKQVKEQALKEGFTPEQIDSSIFVPGDDGVFYMHDAEGVAPRPNAMPLYANIEKPFDIDQIHENWSELAEKMDDVANRLYRDKYVGIDFDRLARSESTQNIDGGSLYKALSRSFESGEPGKAYANRVLQAMGYDGITHTGGLSSRYGSGEPHKVWIAFEPEQIKSATGNKGTFDPLNKDIRYQRGPIGKAKDMAQETLNRVSKFAELDNLESRGGIHAVVAKAMKAFYATRSFMEGRPQAFEKAMYDLSPERRVMLGKHIGQEFDQQRFIKPASEIAAAYNEYRQQWQKFWPNEANKAGHTVRTAGGQRARLTDPYYGPFHMWNDNVRDIMTNKQGSPEYVKLQDDYIKQHVQAHQQRGIPLQEAQTRAAAEFADEVRTMSVPYDPTAAGTFAGARKAQGIPLPDSWREYDIVKLIKNYDRRSAIDFAMQEHMEKSPEVMAALGAKTFFNDQPIPAQIKAVIPDISADKSVQSILREMSGQPATKPDSVGAGASRGVGALTIGTVSKATEVPTTMIAGLRYLQMSDYLPGTMKFIEKLADWSALQERSYASGLNKRDASQNMRQVSGVAENAAGFLNKFAEGVSSVTGLNKLEQAARTMAQGWGEVLVQINKNKAATGDKEAVRMLDTLSSDWRTRSDADLAAQFGKLMQGSYDMTQLPAWILESGAAPYLTWSKWSAGQYNNFVKFAIEPALQGNVKPLIGHLLIGVMGGAAVDQIREWMNNREGRDVNWNELESWMQQNQGQLGAEGMKQLSVKLLNIMQGVGTFGIAGDIAKMVTTAAVGGTAQGMATAPVANAVFDTSKKVAAALKAIDDGEDFGLVLRQAMGDIAQTHIQVARVGRNWLDEQENLRYDDRRQRRLYDELTGAPTQAGTFSVNYGNLAERAFERGELGGNTGEEAMSLVMRARQEATSPEDYASRIRKLKTSQNQIMPSLERQPMKAARYLSWLEGTEEGKGGETMRRYMIRQSEDKYRKSLIEGLSGLR